MKFAATIMGAFLLTTSQACYLTAHSSTVGNFNVQHSAPSDHGGAAQTITGSKGACSFAGGLSNACTVSLTKNVGCGSLYFTIRKPGKLRV